MSSVVADRGVLRARLIIVVLAAGVLLAAIVGFNMWKANFVAQLRMKNAAPPQTVTTAAAGFSDWQPEVTAVGSLRAVRGVDVTTEVTGLVRSVRLFDVYRPTQPGGGIAAGEHSMALRLELLDDAANLTDERIDAAVAAAVQRAAQAFGARLRA